MPYEVKGKCIYKKDGGAKVGCTKGSVDKYLAALHANANESIDLNEMNTLKGGKSDNLSLQDIADKFNVPVTQIQSQIQKGIQVEMEHTSDKEKATEIATDHVSEFPDYYDRLDKMENKASKEWKTTDVTENTKSLIKRLIRENINDRAKYLAWKRKNVTLRGVSNPNGENNAGASFGEGLYTAFLSNREMAKKYGEVYFVVGAIPKKPKVFNGTNEAEIFLQELVTVFCKEHNVQRSTHFFSENTTIAKEMLKRGYDGIVIRGREMVNYTPPSNIKYFKTENQLYNYFEFINS